MTNRLKLLIALTLVVTIAAWVILVIIPTQVAKRGYEGARIVGEDLRKAFNFTPKVEVNNVIVLQQQSGVFELSVLSQNFEHRYLWKNVWLGSTKRITITGSFNARVGFDLHKKFSIELRDGQAIVTLDEPRVLSVESLGDIEYRDEQGIWNWVNTDDRNRATNAFIADARRYAERADFVNDAKLQMEQRLQEVLKPHVDEVVVRYTSTLSEPR